MKKSIFTMMLVAILFLLILGSGSIAAYADNGAALANKNVKNATDIKVFVYDRPVVFDTPIKISEGRTLVPLRKIVEALHYNVQYIPENKEVRINRDTNFIKLFINQNSVFISNSYDMAEDYFMLETQPAIYEGRTYVPLRAVAELCGTWVNWDAKTKTISINGVLGAGGNAELNSEFDDVRAYYYYGQVMEKEPNGIGFLRYGFEMSSYYRGEFRDKLPNGAGVMCYATGLDTYRMLGKFKDGMLIDGTVKRGDGFSIIRDKKVVKTYALEKGLYKVVANDTELDENWQKMMQSEVSVFK